uniref:Ion_trans domain-containing protein n=1 Tax=Ascaris lumbricoides TaxID=6252 RepID=A0A0M3INQ4_ASCLU
MHASSISFLHRYVVMSVQPIAAAFFDIMDLLTFVVVKWWPRGLIKKLVHRMTNVRCFHAAELLSKVSQPTGGVRVQRFLVDGVVMFRSEALLLVALTVLSGCLILFLSLLSTAVSIA